MEDDDITVLGIKPNAKETFRMKHSSWPCKNLHFVAGQLVYEQGRVLIDSKYNKYLFKLPKRKIQNNLTRAFYFYVGSSFLEVDEDNRFLNIGLNRLKRMGYEIVQVPVNNLQRWLVNQKFAYGILPASMARKYMKRNTIPKEHEIEYDQISKKVRLLGKHAGPKGYGGWV